MVFKLDKIILNNVSVTVQIGDPPLQQPKLVNLNLDDNLSNIRKELENSEIINDTLSFSKKIFDKFSEIVHEEVPLKEIVETKDNKYVLYLKKLPDWKTLNELHKLDYGCIVTSDEIKIAAERAFVIKDCKLTTIGDEGQRNGKLEFDTQNDWTKKSNLFFNINDNKTKDKIKSAYNEYTEFGKVTLELITEKLELTDNFKNDIENAIKSEDPVEEFKKITKKYGQFIATKVILGERVFKKSSKTKIHEIGDNFGNSKIKLKTYSFDNMQLLEGKHFVDENFNEKSWIESLEDYQRWDRIILQKLVSIFQLLPNDLRKQILESIGKKILYLGVDDYDYIPNVSGGPKIVELTQIGVKTDDSKILLNEEARCRIFATVVDVEESKKDLFNCQILSPPGGKPSLIIHCIRKSEKYEFKLRIGIMIVGYDTNFDLESKDKLKVLEYKVIASNGKSSKVTLSNLNCNNRPFYIRIPVLSELDSENNSCIIGHHFYEQENNIGAYTFSYCLKRSRHVDLPKSTIYTLIISRYDGRHKYGTLPLKSNIFTRSQTRYTQPRPQPKYISLFSKSGCGPIFTKQKNNQIEIIKYFKCREEIPKLCSICKNGKLSIENIECKYFDPFSN